MAEKQIEVLEDVEWMEEAAVSPEGNYPF
jgi:hypothetical protein